tara:strand:+ start:488 stop:826 length:339 start_codon:yes stop_codon:yes gene_type:complete
MATNANPPHASRTLFFGDANQTASADALLARSENFVSMELASATTAKVSFTANSNAAAVDTATFTFSGSFSDACNAFADILNRGGDRHTVVADQKRGIYAYPFSGTVTVTEG